MVEFLAGRFVENYLEILLGFVFIPMALFFVFCKAHENFTEPYLNLAFSGAMIPSGILLVILAFDHDVLLQMENPPGAVFIAAGLVLAFTSFAKIRGVFRANRAQK